MATQQTDIDVNYANQVINLVQQLANIRATAKQLVAINTDNPLGNLWAKFNTMSLTFDGGPGTADTPGTPVATNYIDTRLYPGVSRAVKPQDLTNGLQAIVDFVAFCAGTALSAQAARPAQINALGM